MSMQFNPYVSFPGTAAEAMAYYAGILGGTPQVMSFRDTGMDVDGVMHAALETPAGFHLFAADHVDGMGMGDFTPGNNVQLSLSGDEEPALRGYFDALAADGSVVVPLEKQIWGDVYGQVVDRYGLTWHVNIGVAGE